MSGSAVGQVRSFNRLITERVGALNDHYLARDRPLGEARLLWEIGVDGADVRRLRSRLGLDSGYLSRLLRRVLSDALCLILRPLICSLALPKQFFCVRSVA